MRRRALAVIFGLLLLGGASLAYVGGFRLPDFAIPGDEAPAASRTSPVPPPTASATPESALVDALGAQPGANPQPKFDIARVDPKGVSVFAGRAAPNAVVTILENGQTVGSVKADAYGEWAMSAEYKFASSDPKLTLEARPAGPEDKLAATAPGAVGNRPPPAGAPTSGAVTARLMESFEQLVESARRETAAKAPPAEPRAAAKSPAPSESPRVAEISRPIGEGHSPPTAVAGLQATAPAEELKSSRSPPAPAVAASIPIPITFIYREANFTDDGRRAAALLLEYLKLKGFRSVALSGHADEIGGPEYNMALSKERLDAVARFLRAGGFAGKLDLIPKGETEPFIGVERTRMALDEVRQLDRRVELRLTN